MYQYKIVVDSCCELPEQFIHDNRFEIVPLTLGIGDYEVLDDQNFDREDFIEIATESERCPNSSCPSPESFMNAFHTEAERVYVITLSSNVSSSYSSACLAARLYQEDFEQKKIYVIDSRSAACGETQIALKLIDLEEKGYSFEEITEEIQMFVNSMKTLLVLNNMDYLRRNGRLSAVKAMQAGSLHIKQILSTAKDGSIALVGQAVGMHKAVRKMVDTILKQVSAGEKRRVVISHTNCPETAELLKRNLSQKGQFEDIIVMNNVGVSSIYVQDGVMISY